VGTGKLNSLMINIVIIRSIIRDKKAMFLYY
jgi:hypothetical protein